MKTKKGILFFLLLFCPISLYAQGFFPKTYIYSQKGIFRSSNWHLDKIHTQIAQQFACGNNVWVVVIDTGVDIDHPALNGHLLLDLAKNFGDRNRESIDDLNGHGTMIAGAILQIAPCAQIIPLKINKEGENSFKESALNNALDYTLYLIEIHPEIKVVNLSLIVDAPNEEIIQKIDAIYKKGILIIAAAGNEGKKGIDFPASLKQTIAVSSTNESNTLAPGANYGAALTLIAPGVNIYVPYLNGIYIYATGSSLATALVSGAAALVNEITSDTGMTLWALLTGSTDLEDIGHDEKTGFGLINVAQAVKYALQRDIYVLPSTLQLKVNEERIIYFLPQDALIDAISGPIQLEEKGNGYLKLQADSVGQGYINLCHQDQCRRLNINIVSEENVSPKTEVFFYPHKICNTNAGWLYVIYDLQVEKKQQVTIDFWITYWSQDVFFKDLSHWNIVLEKGFWWNLLFMPISIKDLAEGIYEIGTYLGTKQRDFLIVWP